LHIGGEYVVTSTDRVDESAQNTLARK